MQNGSPWTCKASDDDDHGDNDDYEDDDAHDNDEDCNSMCRMGLLGLARPLTHHLPMFLGDNKDSRTHCVPISYNFSVSASTRSNELSA